MKIIKTPLQDAYIIEPEPFVDDRGKFARLYCHEELQQIGHFKPIVQVNYSLTRQKGTIRGMHFQYSPKAEIKMVRCLRGSVFDVIIDLRCGSPTFLQWCGEILSEKNMKMMYIPEGFAHGFQTLENNSEFLYLVTEFYSPKHEGGISYNDPLINISWPLEVTDISERDKELPLLSNEFQGIEIY